MKLSQAYPDLDVKSRVPLVLIRSELDQYSALSMYNFVCYYLICTMTAFMIGLTGVMSPVTLIPLVFGYSFLFFARYMDYIRSEMIALHPSESGFSVSFTTHNVEHTVDDIIGVWTFGRDIFHVHEIIRTLDHHYHQVSNHD